MRDLGRPWFSWTDLRAIVRRARTDHTMELFREWNPDTWMWADATPMLLSELSSMVSELRYFIAWRMPWKEDMPDEYLPARYGPPRPERVDTVDEDGEAVDQVEMARQVAASMR